MTAAQILGEYIQALGVIAQQTPPQFVRAERGVL